jgi:hypothetical protein
MGNYIPFDRKKAEGYARALRKRQQRERQKAKDKTVSDQLLAEEVAKKIEDIRNRSKESPKPKPDHATIALQKALDIIRSETAFKIKCLTGAVRVNDNETVDFVNTEDKKYLSKTGYLAYHRYSGVITTGSRAQSLLKWAERAMKLSEKAAGILDREAVLSAISIRMAAREEIKLLNSDERREILDMWKVRRELYTQIGEKESTNAKWLDLIGRSYDPTDTTITKLI